MEESLVLPLFPMSVVIVPSSTWMIKETEKPLFELLKYCSENKQPFAAVYSDEEGGIHEIGCICEILEYQINQNEIVCTFKGLDRISKDSIVSIQNGREEVICNDKITYFELNEPKEAMPFSFIKGAIFSDENIKIRSDVRDDVLVKFIEIAIDKAEPDCHNTSINVSKQERAEDLSFIVLNYLVGDESREDNLIRYKFLAKRSENQRLRLLRNMLCGKGSSKYTN